MADQAIGHKSRIEERMDKLEMKVEQMGAEMTKGFTVMAEKLSDIKVSVDKQTRDAKDLAEDTYIKRQDDMVLALARLDNPAYRNKAMSLVDDWLRTPHGMEMMDTCFRKLAQNTRDQASKWISFAKMIISVLVAAGLLYGGTVVIQTQNSNQKALIDKIESIGD